MIVDLTPLLRGDRGETIRVAGVRAGEAATAIERAALTGADADHGGEPPDRPITHVRTGRDGRRVEIPLAERVATVLQQGGWLWCGDSVLRESRPDWSDRCVPANLPTGKLAYWQSCQYQ